MPIRTHPDKADILRKGAIYLQNAFTFSSFLFYFSSYKKCLYFKLNYRHDLLKGRRVYTAAVSCSSVTARLGGVKMGIWLTGKLGRTWVGSWVGAWGDGITTWIGEIGFGFLGMSGW